MTIKYGNIEISCDSCIETDGRLTLYKDGVPIRTIANIPDLGKVESDGGEIEHSPSPLQKALEDLEEKKEELRELLADDEALRARLERIRALVAALGESMTLTKLIQFIKDLKEILQEAQNG